MENKLAMGDKKVTSEYDDGQMRSFTLGVLSDLQALEHMLETSMFEETERRIGAEQEMFLVDSAMHGIDLLSHRRQDVFDILLGRVRVYKTEP